MAVENQNEALDNEKKYKEIQTDISNYLIETFKDIKSNNQKEQIISKINTSLSHNKRNELIDYIKSQALKVKEYENCDDQNQFIFLLKGLEVTEENLSDIRKHIYEFGACVLNNTGPLAKKETPNYESTYNPGLENNNNVIKTPNEQGGVTVVINNGTYNSENLENIPNEIRFNLTGYGFFYNNSGIGGARRDHLKGISGIGSSDGNFGSIKKGGFEEFQLRFKYTIKKFRISYTEDGYLEVKDINNEKDYKPTNNYNRQDLYNTITIDNSGENTLHFGDNADVERGEHGTFVEFGINVITPGFHRKRPISAEDNIHPHQRPQKYYHR